MSQIEIKNVSKYFGKTAALEQVSMTFEENHIYGLLGRNGAGKSTLLNLITARFLPDSGEILVDGQPVWENDAALSKIYCMSEASLFPGDMRFRDLIRWTAQFYPGFNTQYAYGLCQKFELDPTKKLGGLSTGYTTIYKVILALACSAPIILFDEQLLGLDAHFREIFYKELMESQNIHPRTFILSTHLIEEISHIIDRVAVLKKGSLLLCEEADSLTDRGYSVTGTARAVDDYLQGKQALGEESLGGLKCAYLLGERIPAEPGSMLEFGKLDLQKLIIQLTNS